VRDGKGSKRRVIPINEKVLNDFRNYLHYERFAQQGETALITNNAGRRMRGDKINNTVKELILKAGIKSPAFAEATAGKEISLHNLRHSIATHLLENGMTVEYVRDFLGHKHLEATQIYTRVSKRILKKL
jgi:integrase/recombinase XerD